ncbi:hypothetical protein [Entomobacter blattae]|uniref:CO dehydrogenase flavoprotein C-terminal domain-containing protein n=1 Tax=Entomobacter blattae TaxID=2762277 RepID=A0A7H1NQD8_9PROT|nr:hypothetical protein [Entomobacter blattae]QNT77998.1 hypothetical protein JGUZn3_07650 [Entomobacter blattae]
MIVHTVHIMIIHTVSYGKKKTLIKANHNVSPLKISFGSRLAAQQALHKDSKPLSDVRASSWYRLEVAKNLLAQFYMEDTG